MSAQRLKPATPTTPGDLLASRGLPTILWNNDGDDLAWPAYPEHHADGLWCPGSGHDERIALPRIQSLADYLAARIGPLAKTKTQGLSYCGNFGVPVWDLKRDHIAALGDDQMDFFPLRNISTADEVDAYPWPDAAAPYRYEELAEKVAQKQREDHPVFIGGDRKSVV